MLLTAISDAKPEGQALKQQICDEFGEDMDGRELADYLKAYAQEVTNTDVKLMAEKQNSARPLEIPNSSKQFPRPASSRPHRIHSNPYDSIGKTQASSGRILSLVK